MELTNINMLQLWIIFIVWKSCSGVPLVSILSWKYADDVSLLPLTVHPSRHHPQYILHQRTELGQQKEHRPGSAGKHKRQLLVTSGLKMVSKRDTSSLRDFRTNLNKLLIHQLRKQAFNTSRHDRNNFKIPNTLTNAQSFINQFINNKPNQVKTSSDLTMGFLGIRNTDGNMDNLRRRPSDNVMKISNPNQDSQSSDMFMHNRQGESYFEQSLAGRRENFDMVKQEETFNFTTARHLHDHNQMSVHDSGVDHISRFVTTTEDYRTTLTRQYGVVIPTKPKDILSPATERHNAQTVSPGTVTRRVPDIHQKTAPASILYTEKKEIIYNSSPNMHTSAFNEVPDINTVKATTVEHTNTLKTVQPLLPEGSTENTQIQNIDSNPSPLFTTNVHLGAPTLDVNIQTRSYSIHAEPMPATEPTASYTSKELPSDRTVPVSQKQNIKARKPINNTTNGHRNTLINLQGIHILFTHDKPNYSAISKNPTLHLTASVKTPLKEDHSRHGGHTAKIKTSPNDVRFSTFSKNKYVGTAMIRNGHLFLVIYPPDVIVKHSNFSEYSQTKEYKSETPEANMGNFKTGHGINRPTVSKHSSLSDISGSSVQSVVKHESPLHSLLAPAITNTIVTSLRPNTTHKSSAAYSHRPATVISPTPSHEPMTKHHQIKDETLPRTNEIGQSSQGHVSSVGSLHDQHVHVTPAENIHESHRKIEKSTNKMVDQIVTTGSNINSKEHILQGWSAISKHREPISQLDHAMHHKSNAHLMHNIPAKASDPFESLHGQTMANHRMHGDTRAAENSTTKRRFHHAHKSAKRFGSPWKNVDLSSVLPKISNIKSRKISVSDDDSKPHLSVYSFVAKATDPFDKIQGILNNLQTTGNNRAGGHQTNFSDDTSFNFELTVHSDSGADTASSSDDENKNFISKNDTADELLELLSSTIQHAANAYDMELQRDEILRRLAAFAKIESYNSSGAEKSSNDILYDSKRNHENKTMATEDQYSTNAVTKHSFEDEIQSLSAVPTLSTEAEVVHKSVTNISVEKDTIHNVLQLPTDIGTKPTKTPKIINHTRTDSNKQFVSEKNTADNHFRNNTSNLTRHPSFPPDIMQVIGSVNENERTKYIRTQIVQDIIRTQPTLPPTTKPKIKTLVQFSHLSSADNVFQQVNHQNIDNFVQHPNHPSADKFVQQPNRPIADNFAQQPNHPSADNFVQQPNHSSEDKFSQHPNNPSLVTEPVLQEFFQRRRNFNTSNKGFVTNDLFSKKQTSRQEIQHEMPLSKALYLIKQQTNELRSQKAFEQLTKPTINPPLDSEFNAMLILSIDDILSDHTNLHGALVVSFLTENGNTHSQT